LKTKKTERGFKYTEFVDRNGIECSLQKSSLATDDCVWLGANEIGLKRFTPYVGWKNVELQMDDPYGISHVANNRMHLTRELLPHLQKFVKTGEL
jgi:hypothetical protein